MRETEEGETKEASNESADSFEQYLLLLSRKETMLPCRSKDVSPKQNSLRGNYNNTSIKACRESVSIACKYSKASKYS